MLSIFIPTLAGLLIRHALTAAGVFLAGQGMIEPGALDGLAGCFEAAAPQNQIATQVIGGAAALGGLLWSGAEKVKRAK